MPRLPLAVALASLLAAILVRPAHAEDRLWKYDDGPDDLSTLQGSKMHPQYAHPGFVSQEAWGAIFRPEASDYPIDITAVELIMAAPSTAPDPTGQMMQATIEIWNSPQAGPDPKQSGPLWSVHTSDFFNPATQKPGTPIQGNTVMKFAFTSSKPGDKPPQITSGNIWVMVRVTSEATDKATYWGKTECAKQNIGGIALGCGCQDLAALTDTSTTPKSQIMHIVWPLGTCSGSKAWKYVEEINNGLVQMKGDFRLRMYTAGGGTSSGGSSSSGGTVDAGSAPQDAGSAGQDAGGADKDAGSADKDTVPAKPVIDLVTPSEGTEGEVTAITLLGSGFAPGATVAVGPKKAAVGAVTEAKIEANVLPGLAPGAYPVIVENPAGQTGFLDKAFTVKARPEPDAGSPVDAGSDAGGGSFAPGGKLTLDGLTPNVVPCDQDTSVTIYGSGFSSLTEFTVGSTTLLAVNVESATKATALIPKGMAAGRHSLIAKQGSASVAKANAVEVSCKAGGGCAAAPSGADPRAIWWLLGLVGFGLAWRRRRRRCRSRPVGGRVDRAPHPLP